MTVSQLVRLCTNEYLYVEMWHNKHFWEYTKEEMEKLFTDFGTYPVKSWEYCDEYATLYIEV